MFMFLYALFLVFVGNIHDAVLQWAYGVNRTLQQGYGPDNGFQVTKNILNYEFEGISGSGTVVVNEVGDRMADLRWVNNWIDSDFRATSRIAYYTQC